MMLTQGLNLRGGMVAHGLNTGLALALIRLGLDPTVIHILDSGADFVTVQVARGAFRPDEFRPKPR